MKGRYFEEFNVGEKYITPRKTVTEAAITMMVALGGLRMPIFIDDVYAKNTVFGTRIAPGEVILLFMGGLNEELDIWGDTMIGLVGINNVRFKNPLRAGDTIHDEFEIIDLRETSRSDRGLMVDRTICKNQKGAVVAEVEFTHMVIRRPKASSDGL